MGYIGIDKLWDDDDLLIAQLIGGRGMLQQFSAAFGHPRYRSPRPSRFGSLRPFCGPMNTHCQLHAGDMGYRNYVWRGLGNRPDPRRHQHTTRASQIEHLGHAQGPAEWTLGPYSPRLW